MKKHYKLFLLLFIIIVLLILIVIELSSLAEQNTLKDLDSQYDMRLYNYYNNELLAKEYLDVITINNDISYQKIKKQLSHKLSEELQEEIFGYKVYTLQTGPNVYYELQSIKGTLDSGVYTFKLEYVVKTNGYVRNLVTLIYIENGIIIKVRTL